MGNTGSAAFYRDPHVWIQGKNDGCTYCIKGSPQFNAPKPTELNTVDTTLWNSFSLELNEHVPKINVGLRCVFLCYMVVAVPLFAFFIFMPVIPALRDAAIPYLKFSSVYVIVPMVVFFLAYSRIINKNLKADSAIKDVCESYKTKFEPKGFSIEYRTMFTGYCKPKHATPTRIIAFPPVPEFQESQTTDDAGFIAKSNSTSNDPSDNDYSKDVKEFKPDFKLTSNNRPSDDDGLIDRKAWGLE